MEESMCIRVTKIRIGFVVKAKVFVVIAAAFLAMGYGDGFSPSA